MKINKRQNKEEKMKKRRTAKKVIKFLEADYTDHKLVLRCFCVIGIQPENQTTRVCIVWESHYMTLCLNL